MNFDVSNLSFELLAMLIYLLTEICSNREFDMQVFVDYFVMF